jgi:ribitol 2-dehydrogenase
MDTTGRRVALITGASAGIGRSAARALAATGWRLALVGRSAQRLEELRQELDGDALVLTADVAKPGVAEALVQQALQHFGQIDAVFANAGVYLDGAVAETDPELIRHTIDVNVYASLAIGRAVLPHFIGRSTGDLLFTSSISGHQAIDSEPVYSASKHAVQAFAEALRQQIRGSGVRVATIAPGVVLTDLWGYPEGDPRVGSRLAAGTGILPEDVADAVVYMLTRPRHVTIRDLVILPTAQNI